MGGNASRETETLQFKQWFADSKVVDENGKPLVVYHGTNVDFYSFDTENGAWFSKSPEYAESMSEERHGNRIIECYLSTIITIHILDDRL